MDNVFNYINPFTKLGQTRYSFTFALVANILLVILSEFFAYGIAKDPLIVGTYIIFLNTGFIIYFSFRDGVISGVVTAGIAMLYYAYIIYTRHYQGHMLSASIDTTIILGIIYALLAYVIGSLKQTIDTLLEKEANAKARLETILDQLPTGIIITDQTGLIEFVNKYNRKLFGESVKVGTVIGESYKMVFNIKDAPVRRIDSPSAQVLHTGKPSKEKDFIFNTENGGKLYITARAAPIRNKRGELIAVASISNDVTVQKEIEQQKDDFINMASHELKTPLTSAKVFGQVLQKQLEKKEDKSSIDLINRMNLQLNKLTLLVGDMLDITRMQKGKMKVEKEKIFIYDLAKEIAKDLQPITSHVLTLQWTTRLPIYGDKERLRQVLTNLVTNAIKYSPGKEKIIIGSRQNGESLEVFVKDFGIGIPKSEHKKIFTRFYQVSEHSTYPGLGLGLYISSLIINQHHGKLWVESKKGMGSTFWFSLPIYAN